jgi:ATP-dependent Lon protease
LLPKQLKAAGLDVSDVSVSDEAIRLLVRDYTREAGVRELERTIASICRKIARKKTRGKKSGKAYRITASTLKNYLGVPKHTGFAVEKKNRVGIATGLAWTEYGGDLLTVEVAVLPGRGELFLTGKLGEVMKESGQAALSYARSRAEVLGLDKTFYKRVDIHVHVPEGAIPKDGPSAGTAIATAMVSALTGIPTRSDLALTGEITLRGNILSIGGLTEKLVVARRAGLPVVVIPKGNEKDIPELPIEVKQGLKIISLDEMDDALRVALASDAKTLPIFDGTSLSYRSPAASH